MCGIAGVLNLSGAPANPELPRRMIDAIRHRGPDGDGVYANGPVALGHVRLSIIDIAGGAQPMSIEGDSIWITFNGEIFNYVELREELVKKGHQFRTRSDTEVILHLYREEGDRCVKRLNGQWAFAIWDADRRRLFLSRDRHGMRPLFYTQTLDNFLFASETKALFACREVDRQLDIEALNEIFTFWVTLPPRTAFRNVLQLPPGHSMVVEEGQVRIWQHWGLTLEPGVADAATVKRQTEELLALLLDATRIRLRSDVPVGAYLSGGLDSTLIAALAKQAAGDRLRTFSIGFEDAELDETVFQQESSQFLDTQHSSIRCSHQAIASSFSDIIWHAEQPLLRMAPAPLLMLAKLVRQSGYKVVLTGEGADEILGGYDIFKEAKIRRFWGQQPSSSWRPLLLKRLYPYMENLQRQSTAYLKRFFQVTLEDMANPFFSHLPRWNLTSKVKTFFSDDILAALDVGRPIAELTGALPASYMGLGHFSRAEYLEATLLLPGYILSSQGDRVAMAHSVEGRYPFLDHRVVEFAAKVDPRAKMKVLDEKHLLKRAANGLVPDSVRRRHKQPYRAPDGPSFIGSQSEYLQDLLSFERVGRDGIFDPQSVSQLIRKFKSGVETSVGDNMALVGILSTEALLDLFVNNKNPTVSA